MARSEGMESARGGPSRGWSYYLNPFWSETHLLTTLLSIDECLERLRDRLVPWWESGRTLYRPEVTLARRAGRLVWGGSWRRMFVVSRFRRFVSVFAWGRLAPTAQGTSVTVTFGLGRPIALVFVVGLALIGLTWVLPLLQHGETTAGLVIGSFALFGGFGFLAYARHRARDDAGWLIWFIRNTLEEQKEGSE
jgi:hypothetical protein